MNPPWRLTEYASLLERNTFRVQARAHWLLEIFDPATMPEALALPALAGQPLLPLGGGSNLLFAGDPEGVVVSLGNHGIDTLEHRADFAIVRADAGVPWHELVMWSLEQGLSGLENLALIPGTTGAAPIQNIGAYGTQLDEFVHVVEAWDRHSESFVRMAPEDCGFGYRDSLFKHETDRYLIVALELRLPRLNDLRLDYPGIREELAAMQIETPIAADVAQAVIRLRQRKLPDPAVLGNAGSFFKNPILPVEQAEVLLHEHPGLPLFAGTSAATRKVSAAWMIEACGWKGFREGDVGVAATHALVLVNHGQASGMQLLELAHRISASVLETFGVAIEPEPKIIGARW